MFEDLADSILNKAVISRVVVVTFCLPGIADVSKRMSVRTLGRGTPMAFTGWSARVIGNRCSIAAR